MPKLTPAQRQYIRKRTKVVELDPSEASSELNIIPFLDIVVNLIIFLLATVAYILPTVQLDTQLPELGGKTGGRSGEESALNLNLTIVEQGVIVTGSGGKLARGCKRTGQGRVITVPRSGATYNWEELRECMRVVKEQFAEEEQATLSADPLIHYEHVVAAMDAIRGSKDDKLFPKILLSAGVR